MTTSPLMAFLSSLMDATIAVRSLLNFTISCFSTMASDGSSPFSCERHTHEHGSTGSARASCVEAKDTTHFSGIARNKGGLTEKHLERQ